MNNPRPIQGAAPPSDGIAPQHRQNNFDFVRLMAASFVLFSHMYALTGKAEPELATDHSLGNIGLLIFFSISGYLVTLSWLSDPNPWRFLARRGLRIWPALAVIVMISAFVIAPVFGDGFCAIFCGLIHALALSWLPKSNTTLRSG